MSDNDEWYLKSHKPSLRGWIFTQMTLGAVYAALVFFGVIAVILIIYALSFLLPEDPFAALAPALPALSAIV